MPEPMTPGRRAKRSLSAEQKYEIWSKTLTGELTSREAPAQTGVDRSTIMTLRKTARDGAVVALQVSQPGRPRDAREASELARLEAESGRLSATIVEQAIELAALCGNRPGG
jgi:transposase